MSLLAFGLTGEVNLELVKYATDEYREHTYTLRKPIIYQWSVLFRIQQIQTCGSCEILRLYPIF
jgi:hypothetical protein